MGRRRFKRTGLRDDQKAEVVKTIGAARRVINQVTLNYYFEQPEYQAACRANDALLELGDILGRADDSMWRGCATQVTAPEKKEP
ncbi:hypothetical protein [Emcibacter sp. SYSU 3D8]|uniref:hypothetical protein n=1 Tax=Emcibacter sp. SYSU 3D8 TaxID=3133969 RepID=UPI0031FEB883